MSTIQSTKIYKKLKKLDESFANDVLKNSNSIIELINKKTTINFPNYTNHDIRHSISIINTMYDLIKDNDDFSALEYALMIYAAIFHDIGMAVDDEEIKKIKNNNSTYLYNQDFTLIKENLFDNEELAIQEVVRNAHGKIANDLIRTKYKEHFKLLNRNIYFDEHLGMICQAHTEDKSYLEKIPTEKSKGNYTYNPRFIAILLRVADILDIDDTRTPIELYNSIDLNDYSNEEWQKNFVIENSKKIHKRNKLKEIRLEGTCENIKVHRKLLNYIKWIENELSILVNMTSDMKDEYQININTEVKNNIEPKGYTIPDLKLNMDYHAITNLLMGEAIYGSKDLGLRELLQNSIDAIMVKKDKLEMENHPLKDSYEPTINIDIDEENNKLIIKDNGMGMNEHIIKNYFLNVGKSYYKSKDFMNYNHNYNPIGNFGIGFLSCFMLSNEVQVITKYFNSNKTYVIDLEKDSQYIAFKEEEDSNYMSGTEIILDLNSFCNALKTDSSEMIFTISTFINNNILFDNITLLINNQEIDLISKNKPLKAEYIIDISEYTKNLSGYIKISENNYFKEISSILDNISYILYFDGKDFIKINSLNKLNFNNIIYNLNLEYFKIPILTYSVENDFSVLLESNQFSISEAIETLDDNGDIYEYIYLFIDKSCQRDSGIHRGGDGNDIIFWITDEEGKDTDYFLKDVIDALNLNTNGSTPVFIRDNIYTICLNNKLLPFSKSKYYFSNYNFYIKNIKIKGEINLNNRANFIRIIDMFINIKDNNLISNISRTKLTNDSFELFSYSIRKIIHEFALNNFKLTKENKKLLKEFNSIFYSKDSILLK
ncbi:MAG: ATP-binding protein [Arcobacter sp.]|uniref:HD domain-containing protein n=1 Tax=Arcobacter sp. TaxID=1872629 RepID=UPI003B002AF8